MENHEETMREADEKAMPTRRAILRAAIGTAAVAAALSSLYVGAGLIPRVTRTPENEPPQEVDLALRFLRP